MPGSIPDDPFVAIGNGARVGNNLTEPVSQMGNIGGVMPSDNTRVNVEYPMDYYPEPEYHTMDREPFGFWEYFFSGGQENGRRYRMDGKYIGPSPIMGYPPDVMGGTWKKTIQLIAKPRTVTKALELAEKFLGKGYNEIAPGVFRSANKLRQFRMTNSDLLGKTFNGIPHVHFEYLNTSGNVIKNYHVPLIKP